MKSFKEKEPSKLESLKQTKKDIHKPLEGNLDTIDLVKILPCETTEDILESVFDKKEKFWEPIDSILNKEFTIEWFLKSQEEEDELTEIIYKKVNKDGKILIVFPQKIAESNTPPYLWKIWEQTSKYHKETLLEHIAMVIAWISKINKNDNNMELVALLHDSWKKYTSWTYKNWEICFFWHEKVSAYLAATIYRQLWFTKEESEPYVRIIHDHMLPFRERSQKEWSKEKYRELYGNYITEGIITLNKCDFWITQEDENNLGVLTGKRKLIEKWKTILNALKTKDFRKKINLS